MLAYTLSDNCRDSPFLLDIVYLRKVNRMPSTSSVLFCVEKAISTDHNFLDEKQYKSKTNQPKFTSVFEPSLFCGYFLIDTAFAL